MFITGRARQVVGKSIRPAPGGRPIGLLEERAKDPTALVDLFQTHDRDKVAVDTVLEHASGQAIGIDVKAAETVRGDDFRELRYLADRAHQP